MIRIVVDNYGKQILRLGRVLPINIINPLPVSSYTAERDK